MVKEISAGAVIYKIENNVVHYLIEYMTLGHISLCKGHLEEGESLVEAAIREAYEETSLNIDLDTNFHHVITYSPKEDVIKDVHFFIGKAIDSTSPIDRHDTEVIKSTFLPYEEALSILTYKTDKETLRLANIYILEKEVI